MHHSSDDSPDRQSKFIEEIFGPRQSFEEAMAVHAAALEELGATGRFPEGKLSEDDEGETRIAIGSKRGKVVMHFGHPTTWIGFSPAQAREIAATLQARATEAESQP